VPEPRYPGLQVAGGDLVSIFKHPVTGCRMEIWRQADGSVLIGLDLGTGWGLYGLPAELVPDVAGGLLKAAGVNCRLVPEE
jgi:hypothetical protein